MHGSTNAARDQFRSASKRQRQVANLIERLVPEHDKANSIIVIGSAQFAKSMRGSQTSPVGLLIKEIAKRRRVVLVDEYFTTQMCSGCHLGGLRCGHHQHQVFPAQVPAKLSSLRPTSSLRFLGTPKNFFILHPKHPTRAMANFARTSVPAAMQVRLDARKAKQEVFANLMVARGLRPPDPGGGAAGAGGAPNQFNPLRGAIHGLKQCVHCGRFWGRDLNAARNIGWVFLGAWLDGLRPVHLRRPEKKLESSPSLAQKNRPFQHTHTHKNRTALIFLIAVPFLPVTWRNYGLTGKFRRCSSFTGGQL